MIKLQGCTGGSQWYFPRECRKTKRVYSRYAWTDWWYRPPYTAPAGSTVSCAPNLDPLSLLLFLPQPLGAIRDQNFSKRSVVSTRAHLMSVHGWTMAFLLNFHIFLPRWLQTGCQRVSPWNTPRRPGIEAGYGEDRQWDTFILALSNHDPGHGGGQTVRYSTFILPLSSHDPGHREDRKWDTFILSLSYHGPGHGEDRQWDTFTLPLSSHDPGHREDRKWDTVHSFSHWAIMTWATGRTDSEIHSFSHWAIMTRATERTDSEIHSFSHWAIMARVTGRTDSEIHSFSHWPIMIRATGRTDSELDWFFHIMTLLYLVKYKNTNQLSAAVQMLAYWVSLFFPGSIIRRLTGCTACPMENVRVWYDRVGMRTAGGLRMKIEKSKYLVDMLV